MGCSVGSSRVSTIDGLRGVSASAVLVGQVVLLMSASRWADGGPPQQLEPALQAALTLLVAISGFALYHRYAASVLRRVRPPAPAAFLRDRALRLAPPFVLAALATLVVLGPPRAAAATPPPGGAGTSLAEPGIGWTVLTLLALYALVPLQAQWARRGLRQQRGRIWAGCCLAAPPLVVAGLAVTGLVALDRNRTPVPGDLPLTWLPAAEAVLSVVEAFTLGMVAAVAALALGLPGLRPATRTAWRRTVAALLVAAVACSLVSAPTRDLTVAAAAAAGLVLLAAPGGTVPVRGARALLGVGPVAHLGRLSFGLWLWHLLVIALLLQHWPALRFTDAAGLGVAVACVGVASWLAAETTYWVLEQPLRRLSSRRPGHLPRRHRPRLPAFLPADPAPATAPEVDSRFDIRAPVTLLLPTPRKEQPHNEAIGHGLSAEPPAGRRSRPVSVAGDPAYPLRSRTRE